MTKNQFTLILMPTLVALFVVDRLYHRQLRIRDTLLPAIGVVAGTAIWYVVQLVPLLGTEDVGSVLKLWREASAGAVFVFSVDRMMASLRFLGSPDVFAYWGVAGLAYGLVLSRQRSLDGVRQAFLATFAVIGLAWYAFGSIGWPRYAFPALAVTTIFVAKLFRDLFYALQQADRQSSAADRALRPARALAVLLVLALGIGYPLQNQVRAILKPADRSPQLTAAYLEANVPQSDVIETWEPELGVLTDHRYHYPPTGWLDRAVRGRWLAGGALATGYDPTAYAQPSYLVVGRFGKYTGIYAETVARIASGPVASFGDYDVYRMRST